MGFDTGDDNVDVMKRDDFYEQVLPDLGLKSLLKVEKTITKTDAFFAQIGALATTEALLKNREVVRVIRFDILRSAW